QRLRLGGHGFETRQRRQARSLGGTAMVSRNGHKKDLPQNGSHGGHNGRGSEARRRFDAWRASQRAAGAAARHPQGNGHGRAPGAPGLVVEGSLPDAFGREGAATDSSVVANTVTRFFFIIGSPGVGKTRMIRDLTVSLRERIGGFYTE